MSSEKKFYKPGDILFNDGDASTSLFLIQKGAVSIRKKKGNTTIEVGKILANEVIGELTFFDRKPRSATGVAIVEVEAIEISFESLEKIYATIPDFMKAIMTGLANRLRLANETIQKLQKIPD